MPVYKKSFLILSFLLFLPHLLHAAQAAANATGLPEAIALPGALASVAGALSPLVIQFVSGRLSKDWQKLVVAFAFSAAIGAGAAFMVGAQNYGLIAFGNWAFVCSQIAYRMWFHKLWKR